MKRKFGIWGLIAVLAICLVAQSVSAEGLQTVTFEVEYDYESAAELAEILNEYRVSGDAWQLDSKEQVQQLGALQALQLDETLTAAAMQRAAELAVNFGHTRPDGTDCFTIQKDVRGENAGASCNTAKSMYSLFSEEKQGFDNQGHRRNMLSQRYTHVGVGCVVVNGTRYWIMLFSPWEPKASYESTATENTATVQIAANEENKEIYLRANPEAVVVAAGGTAALPEVTAELKASPKQRSGIPVMADTAWSVADPAIARIDGNAAVTGLREGETVLTAEKSGKTLSIPLRVVPCTHENAEAEVVKESTCVSQGLRRWTCPDCGSAWEEQLPLAAHTPRQIVNEARCGATGFITTRCAVCNLFISQERIPALEHQYGPSYVYREATAEQEGILRQDCVLCGKHLDTPIPKLPTPVPTMAPTPEPTAAPTPVPTPAPCRHARTDTRVETEATCWRAGTAVTVCLDCGAELNRQELPKKEHVRSEVYEETPARCGIEGERRWQCVNFSSCHQYVTETIPAREHFLNVDNGRMVCVYFNCDYSEPIECDHEKLNRRYLSGYSCDVTSTVEITCDRCRLHMGTETLPPHDHTLTANKAIEFPASCTETGLGYYVCVECRQTVSREIPMLPHDYRQNEAGEWVCSMCGQKKPGQAAPHVHTEEELREEPTCETAGRRRVVCAACGEVLADEEIPALGHDWRLTDQILPTCVQPRVLIYTCDRCGETRREEQETLDHQLFEIIQPPEGDTPGRRTVLCSLCREVFVDEEYNGTD